MRENEKNIALRFQLRLPQSDCAFYRPIKRALRCDEPAIRSGREDARLTIYGGSYRIR